jgi:poly(3-hydroxybutyrate) depolymerase
MPVTDVLSMANLHTCNLYTDQSGEGNTEVVGDVVPVPGFLDRPTIVQSVPDPTAPLVVVFHAFGGCIANMQRRSDLDALSPRTGVAMLWVSGAKWPARIADIDRMWYQNESKDPDYLAGQQQDLVYLDAVFAALHQRGMHPRRVVSVGVSLGAGMALTAACLRPNLFTGAISVSGWQPVPCPRNPLSLMMVGGTDDPRGGSVTSTAVATRWRRTVVDCPAPGIRRNDNRVHVTTWQQCTGGTTVRLVTLDGVPHTWPKYTFYNVDQDVIDFALGKYD